MDELDFNSGKLASHYQPGKADPAAKRRVLAVISALGLTVAFIAILVEHRFWWLTLTGRRATAQITERDEEIIGWISTRRLGYTEFPLIETEFQYTFTDDAGAERQGSFRFPEVSDAFRVGDKLSVMYPRFGSGPGEPSDWGFYLRHDSVWFSFTSVGLGFLLLGGVCLVWRRRLQSSATR